MHDLSLLLTLAAGFIVALILGYINHRLGWPPIVGYLLAGVLVGPYTPGFVADEKLANQLAEVGIILLMFGVGLHFHVKDLAAVRRAAVTGALLTSTLAALLGIAAARFFGWNSSAALVYGMALSVASTVVLTRVLSDNGHLRSPTGRIAIGWLVVEDIMAVFALVILPLLLSADAKESGRNLFVPFVLAAAKIAVFVAFILWGGARLIPAIFREVAKTQSRELFTLCVLAVAMGIAAASAEFFGVSMALGAFLAGMVVGQSDFSARAGAEALPMRDAFSVMFFLSIGMLFDPLRALANPLASLLTLGVIMIWKPLVALTVMLGLGYGSRVGLGVALALAQIGEFSFLVAAVGQQRGILPRDAMNSLVAAAMVSIMLNPFFYRCVTPLESWLERRPRLWRKINRRGSPAPDFSSNHEGRGASHRAVVVGYGPIGQAVTRLLRSRGIKAVIIEMNIETHERLKQQGHGTVYGDANQREVLEEAGIAGASSLIVSTSGSSGSLEAIRIARQINPDIHVVTRADFLNQTESLRAAGANEVFCGEGEVAMAILDSILRRLGATPEQLDEERMRIREEIFQPER